MESIVKMGVSGKNTYGKNEQREGAEAQSRKNAASGVYPEHEADFAAAAAGNTKASVSTDAAAASAAVQEMQNTKEQQALEKRLAERKLVAEEESILHRKRKKHYRLIMKYVIATVAISYILIKLTGNLDTVIAAVIKGLKMIGLLLQPLFWGFVLAYILNPLVNYFELRLRSAKALRKKRSSIRGIAVAITCALTCVVLIILLSIVVSAVTRSLKLASLDDLVLVVQSFADSLKGLQQSIMDKLGSLNISTQEVDSAMSQLGQKAAELTLGLSTGLTGAVSHISSFVTNLIFAVIFAVYFLLDGKGLTRYWNRVLVAFFGRKARRNLHILAKDADTVFSGYIRGQLIDALIMSVLISVALSLVGVKYAVIIGVMSGIGNLVPYLGPVIAYGSTILVCLVTGDIRRLLVAVVVIFVIQTIDGNVINPRLLSSNVDVHPMLVIAALIIGGAAGGVVGMLFAVPVAAFLKIQFDKIVDQFMAVRVPEKSTAAKRKKKKSAAKVK